MSKSYFCLPPVPSHPCSLSARGHIRLQMARTRMLGRVLWTCSMISGLPQKNPEACLSAEAYRQSLLVALDDPGTSVGLDGSEESALTIPPPLKKRTKPEDPRRRRHKSGDVAEITRGEPRPRCMTRPAPSEAQAWGTSQSLVFDYSIKCSE